MRAVVAKVACPVPSSVRVPSVDVSSLNVTLPVGVPLPGEAALTAAVNVTDWPKTIVPDDDVTCADVPDWFTTCGAAASLPLLLPKPFVPVKLAVMVWEATESADVLKVACPVASTATPEARTVEPSWNVTVPVGVPPEDVTAAVKVTCCPNTEGFGDDETVVAVDEALCTDWMSVPLLAADCSSEA